MKPLDQFKRTPPRRYDKAPPPPPGDKRTFEPAIRKRYFDMPTLTIGISTAGWAARSAPFCC